MAAIVRRLLSDFSGFRRTLIVLGTKGGSATLRMLGTILLTRLLTVSGFGIYSYLISILSLVRIPTSLGLSQYLVRELPKLRIDDARSNLIGLSSFASVATLVASVAVTVTVVMLIVAGAVRVPDGYYWPSIVAAVSLPFTVLLRTRVSVLHGLNQVVTAQALRSLVRPTLFVAVLLGMLFVTDHAEASVTTVFGIHLFGVATAALLAYAYSEGYLTKIIGEVKGEWNGGKWVKGALPLLAAAGVEELDRHIDIIFLNFYQSDVEVGLYKAASRAALVVGFGMVAANAVARPRIAGAFGSEDSESLGKTYRDAGATALLLAAPAVVALLVMPEMSLSLLFGEAYGQASELLQMLVWAQVANIAFGAVAMTLIMGDREDVVLKVVTLAVILNAALNMILIPQLGTIGAAIATATATATWNAGLAWFIYINYDIMPPVVGIAKKIFQ